VSARAARAMRYRANGRRKVRANLASASGRSGGTNDLHGCLYPADRLAAVTAAAEPAPLDARARLGRWPGVRTLASPHFRRLIGVLFLAVGLLFLVTLLLAVMPAGGFEIDFVAAYRRASLDLLEGRSPYLPEQLSGPFPALRYGWYLYPPVFAQLLTPLAILPPSIGAVLWLLLQALMLFAATWVAASAAGARQTRDRIVWTGVALSFFMPNVEVLWTGNLGGPLALSVGALLGTRAAGRGRDGRRTLIAGALAGAAAVVKLAPFAWLPAVLRAGGGLARGSLFGLGALVVPSVVLVPQAWLDYAQVLVNLIAGDARYPNNLAPAIVALNLGLPGVLVDGVPAFAVRPPGPMRLTGARQLGDSNIALLLYSLG